MGMLAAVLLVVAPIQDESRLREAWPKLVEAWKASEGYKAEPLNEWEDAYLQVSAKVHAGFDAAGLFAAGGEYAPRAIKELIRLKVRTLVPGARGRSATSRSVVVQIHVRTERKPERGIQEVLSDLGKEDDVALKALEVLGLAGSRTPSSLRRRLLVLSRALVKGEAFPGIPAASESTTAEMKRRIKQLGAEDIATREKAARELHDAGDASIPFLREAATSSDAQASAEAKRLLGYGHAPWSPADEDFRALPDWSAYAEMVWKIFVTDEKFSIHRIEIVDAPPAK